MNVIFAGISGTNKEALLKALVRRRAQNFAELSGIENPDDARIRKFIRYADVDKYFSDPDTSEKLDVVAVLVDGEISKVRSDWRQAFRNAISACNGPQVVDKFLAIHASYFFRSRPSIPVDIVELQKFSPDVFVTLINNCYSCWWRIQENEKLAQRGCYLRLQDILKWRQFDLFMVQQIINDLSALKLEGAQPLHHYVFAVKHPIETLYRLLYGPTKLTIYGAHPISDIRRDEDCVAEVEQEYSGLLRNRFILFEPTTIDEKPLQYLYEEQFDANLPTNKGDKVYLKKEALWPVRNPAVPDQEEMFTDKGLELLADEVYQVAIHKDKYGKSEIDLQINERDFWLVRSTKRMVGYRPYWEGKCPSGSEGVIAELNLAARLRKLPRYLNKAGDRSIRGSSPLHDNIRVINNMGELIQALEFDEKRI